MIEGSEPRHGVGAQRGHLDRLARWLLVGGLIALAASTLLTWAMVEGGRGLRDWAVFSDSNLLVSLLAQVLAVLAGALLTGAAFAYVMRAVRLDQQ